MENSPYGKYGSDVKILYTLDKYSFIYNIEYK